MSEEHQAYEAGFDCGAKGATLENCHFSHFSTPQKTKEWERGKLHGERFKVELLEQRAKP